MTISFDIYGGIFNYIGYFFGYVLWFFFEVTKNYGVSLILFTLLVKAILMPFSIKQQKSMAKNARVSAKQRELQKRCGNDKKKYNEELAKLYSEEGMNPAGGCLSSFAPLIVLFGVFYSVSNPLQNTLHIAVGKINEAMSFLQTIPGLGVTFGDRYGQIEVIKLFPLVKNELTMFSANEIQDISQFHSGFNFLGLDLLSTPSTSSFASCMWIIPLLSFLTSVLSTVLMQKIQGNQQMQGQGCMKYMMYIMPLFTTWIAYTVPAAVGFYWIVSTVLQFFQSLILHKHYNIDLLNARSEASRIALRRQQEQDMKPAR